MTREWFKSFRFDMYFGLTIEVTHRCPWMRKHRISKQKSKESVKAPDFVDTS